MAKKLTAKKLINHRDDPLASSGRSERSHRFLPMLGGTFRAIRGAVSLKPGPSTPRSSRSLAFRAIRGAASLFVGIVSRLANAGTVE